MTTIFDSLSDPGFRSFFTDFQYTAFRLETLPVYDVSYEAETFRRFLDGRPRGNNPSIGSWVERVKDGIQHGKKFQRVHIISEPLTDYLRFECAWSYRDSVQAGDDVRIWLVSETNGWPADVPHQDFWLFDSTHLIIMNYSTSGYFEFAELIDDARYIVNANRWRDAAIKGSVPFPAFDIAFDDWMNRKTS